MLPCFSRCRLTFFLAIIAVGCAAQNDDVESPTPTARTPSHSLEHPLTDDEVRTFLSVLKDMPNGTAPQFEPLSQATVNAKLTAARLADIYRLEYRAMFDATRHGERWRTDKALMSVFQRHSVEPEDFAALMIRMSCAVTADSLSRDVNLDDARREADVKLEQMIRDITVLDAAPRTASYSQQRSAALESLQALIALSEFSRILASVPEESCKVIARYRGALEPYLPQADNVEMFERTIESDIVPTSFDEIRPSR